MLRKTALGLAAMTALLVGTVGTASAYPGHHHGYGGYRGGYGAGYRYGYRPPVYVAPAPVYGYGYPGAGGYGCGVRPGYGGYVQPGVGVQTPGFGFYVR